MNQKYITIGIVAFILFVVGLIYLARLESTTPTSSESKFVPYAETLGLDVEKFKLDIASEAVAKRVSDNLGEATAIGARSTPTFLINGVLQDRLPNDVEEMKALFDETAATATVQEIPENVHTKGSQTPKVIVTKYSDIQCPACASYAEVLREYFIQYPDDEVALVYKHFPLKSIHPYAQAAAEATEAAAVQGKFWEMHDLLFEKQSEWGRR